MATKLPRLNVAMTAEQHALLLELGKLQGRSGASFLREMLDAATPMLEASLPIWRAIADEAAAQPERLRALIEQAVADVKGNVAQLDMLELISRTASTGANDAAEAPGQPSGASAPGASASSSNGAKRA